MSSFPTGPISSDSCNNSREDSWQATILKPPNLFSVFLLNYPQLPLLLTWLNFNPNMVPVITCHVKCHMKLLIHSQTLIVSQWKCFIQFHPTLYDRCNYFSMLGLTLNYGSKRGPGVKLYFKGHQFSNADWNKKIWETYPPSILC